MNEQLQLVQIVKRKGTGKTMSQALSLDDLQALGPLLQSPNTCDATKATLITALIMLDKTNDEAQWFHHIIQNPTRTVLSPELYALFFNPPKTNFHAILTTLLNHEHLSVQSMTLGLDYTFNPSYSNTEKAVFLEALRLKEETKLENHTAYDYLRAHSHYEQTLLPHVIDLANPYDGFNRNLYSSLFLAPLLGSIGFPCVLHGIDSIGPKNGVNPNKLLHALNKPIPQTLPEAVSQVSHAGWTYVDQSVLSPKLYAQKQLRLAMVKRPLLATLEKLLMPIRGTSTHLVTGYTHPPYKQKMTDLMISSPMTQGVLFRGVEGSTQLSTTHRVRCRTIRSDHDQECFIDPPKCLSEPDAIAPTDCLTDSMTAGLDALRGDDSPMRPILLHTGSAILDALALMPYAKAWQKLETALCSGNALACWNKTDTYFSQ